MPPATNDREFAEQTESFRALETDTLLRRMQTPEYQLPVVTLALRVLLVSRRTKEPPRFLRQHAQKARLAIGQCEDVDNLLRVIDSDCLDWDPESMLEEGGIFGPFLVSLAKMAGFELRDRQLLRVTTDRTVQNGDIVKEDYTYAGEFATLAGMIYRHEYRRCIAERESADNLEKDGPSPWSSSSNHFVPLISVSWNHVRILIAEYDDDYRKFLDTGNEDKEPFLRVREYGPFDMTNGDDLVALMAFLLAIVAKLEELWQIGTCN
ncbi:hypothetical protein GP486_003621 [Trichoglossum hirsutum]|uniref:Uncharacterized protein n=1 Tax=Trichoglossum hirsutum TaxID=265104 RepID=A0A9P8LCQ6_9PEZI|nr:hypothetical protein GP486_003621 [Trichoglossum hirsutum]